jgi:hypothetical protein
MSFQCPKCKAWNYPCTRTEYGCECCGYNGTITTTSNRTRYVKFNEDGTVQPDWRDKYINEIGRE